MPLIIVFQRRGKIDILFGAFLPQLPDAQPDKCVQFLLRQSVKSISSFLIAALLPRIKARLPVRSCDLQNGIAAGNTPYAYFCCLILIVE